VKYKQARGASGLKQNIIKTAMFQVAAGCYKQRGIELPESFVIFSLGILTIENTELDATRIPNQPAKWPIEPAALNNYYLTNPFLSVYFTLNSTVSVDHRNGLISTLDRNF
jgi:hypothetical protein